MTMMSKVRTILVWIGLFCLAIAVYALIGADEPFVAAGALYGGIGCMFLVAVLFLWSALRERMRRLHYLKCAALVFVLPLFVGVVLGVIDRVTHDRRVARTVAVIESLAAEIEALRQAHGKLPENIAELERMLGKPVPTSAWGCKLWYERDPMNPEHFIISTMSTSLDFTIFKFSSRDSNRGVVLTPF